MTECRSFAHAFPTDGRMQPLTAGDGRTDQKSPHLAFPQVRGSLCWWWQVKDSNLRSFRDGFTVRSHWPLGQPAWECSCASHSSGQQDSRTGAPDCNRVRSACRGPGSGPPHTSTYAARRSLIMAASPSFDIVSKVDRQEVDNAF